MDSLPLLAKENAVLLSTGAVLSYILLVRHLRYRRLNNFLANVEKDCGVVTRSSDLPLYHAETIISNIGTWDFPRVTRLSLQFALFRTYGIPTISSILWKTRQFAERPTAHRRYVDTSVLIVELMAFPLDSPRAKLAIERINYLHNRHKSSISNDDLLYTLALFMCQPAVFIDKYEWRKLHPIEKMGLHRFWSQVGVMMGIQGIPDSFERTYEWANQYEIKYMKPAETNAKVAVATMDILLYFIPGFLHPSVTPIIHAVCDSRLRASFIWPDPPSHLEPIVNAVFGIRAFITRHLILPRFIANHHIEFKAIDDSVPLAERRYYFKLWEADPWYFKKTWWNAYGPVALVCKIMGWGIPGDEFDSIKGYRVGDVGPKSTVGRGVGNEGWVPGSLLGGGSIIGDEKEFREKLMESGGKCPMFMG
ncbi:hypothetical protein H072_9270 [Dactylellina haptotyla CBS 200.50]|uniref:ER-bound oxygenase mpaB/mpaB'/Rubber oxygenase catalytic domain-containing protein n=1 Tax=Dactylellina haptotyla (strain CBS 200.50) TaxID=1284197 RepID=S8A307_DACHA|nr:hypothetical protein H072_9270 [Dactylellina haptotyla CBS 200.50]